MMRPWRFAAVLVAPLLFAVGGDAHAQSKKPPSKPDPKAQPQATPQWKKGSGKPDTKTSEAKRLFDEGAAAYTEGNYEKAIESWEMSYDISKKELICESIANAYERLGQPKKAREYLLRWRNAAPLEERENLDARLKNLEERITREDEAEKQRQAEREKREKEALKSRESSTFGLSTPGLVLAGVGVSAVVAGVVLDIVASGKRPDEKDACRPSANGQQLCLSTEKDPIETSNRLAFVGDILWIGGSVAAAAGGVLIVTQLLSSDTSEKGPEKPKTGLGGAVVAPLVTPHGGGAVLVTRF